MRHLADVTDDLRVPAIQARQTLAIQDIDPAERVGDHVMLVAAMLDPRHLAEEVALFQLDGVSGAPRKPWPRRCRSDTWRRRASPVDTIKAAWLERAGVEQLGNFGHLGSVER
jgi:hypothetical protein